MLPKKNRADKKAVERIFKEGRFLNFPTLTFKFFTEQNGKTSLPRISVIVPKNISKFAVKRNILRRRGYEALKKHIHHFPAGLTGVFIFKKYQEDSPAIENEIKNTLSKLN